MERYLVWQGMNIPVTLREDLLLSATIDDQEITAAGVLELKDKIDKIIKKKQTKINLPLVAWLNGRWQRILYRGIDQRNQEVKVTLENGTKETTTPYGIEFYSIGAADLIPELNRLQTEAYDLQRQAREKTVEQETLLRNRGFARKGVRDIESLVLSVQDKKEVVEGISFDE